MVSAPAFAQLNSVTDFSFFQKTAMRTTRLIFWTSLPLLLCCLLAPAWMMNLFGSNFGTGSSALIMIAIGQFINSISGSVGVIMQMSGHERAWAVILLITFIINAWLMYVLVPRYGLNGAAFSMMVVMIINNVAGAAYVKIRLKIATFYFPFISS